MCDMCVHMCDRNLNHTAKSLECGKPTYGALEGYMEA